VFFLRFRCRSRPRGKAIPANSLVRRALIASIAVGTPLAASAQGATSADSAFAVPIEVKSQGATLRAVLHVTAGTGPHATLVALKGFPGGTTPALSRFMQSSGFNAIEVNVRGQHDSDGNYEVAGAPADVAAIIAFLRSDSARNAFRIDPQRIAITGVSAGSFAALTAAAADSAVRCVNLLVPFNWSVLLLEARSNPVMRSMMAGQEQSIRARVPAAVRMDTGFVTRMFETAESYDLRQVATRLPERNVLMIGAQQDQTAPLDTHFNPVVTALRGARAVVRDTTVDDTHNLPATGTAVFDLVARWLGDCAR
jgi:cephalosporin-C deacetylase-like acetyl esterase